MKPQPQAIGQSVGRQFPFSDKKKLDSKFLTMLGENAQKWHVHRGGKKAKHDMAFASLSGAFIALTGIFCKGGDARRKAIE